MPKPEMTPVKSSNIVAMGLDEAGNTLYVEFPGNVIWTYSNVTKSIYDALLKAPSIGSHFHSSIKMNAAYKPAKYVGDKKVDEPPPRGGVPFGV